MVLEYHGKLDFPKIKYQKSDRSLNISKTVVDCNIICKKVLFGYFHRTMGRLQKVTLSELLVLFFFFFVFLHSNLIDKGNRHLDFGLLVENIKKY